MRGTAGSPVDGDEMVLRMIAYRARLLGGAARYESTGNGARLVVTVPGVRRRAPIAADSVP